MNKMELAKLFWKEGFEHANQFEEEYSFKANLANESIKLPDPKKFQPEMNCFTELIMKRRTLRKYQDKMLTIEQLSFLLWCTQGESLQKNDRSFRTVPSAGCTHPFETYVVINRVENIAAGLYYYDLKNHELKAVVLQKEFNCLALQETFLGQPQVSNCSALFIWLAIPSRTSQRYGIRAYRYFNMDVGHICQNFCLAAESINGGACELGAFNDEKLNDYLELDSNNIFAVYAGTIGFRA